MLEGQLKAIYSAMEIVAPQAGVDLIDWSSTPGAAAGNSRTGQDEYGYQVFDKLTGMLRPASAADVPSACRKDRSEIHQPGAITRPSMMLSPCTTARSPAASRAQAVTIKAALRCTTGS
jgi:hypothetical protein